MLSPASIPYIPFAFPATNNPKLMFCKYYIISFFCLLREFTSIVTLSQSKAIPRHRLMRWELRITTTHKSRYVHILFIVNATHSHFFALNRYFGSTSTCEPTRTPVGSSSHHTLLTPHYWDRPPPAGRACKCWSYILSWVHHLFVVDRLLPYKIRQSRSCPTGGELFTHLRCAQRFTPGVTRFYLQLLSLHWNIYILSILFIAISNLKFPAGLPWLSSTHKFWLRQNSW